MFVRKSTHARVTAENADLKSRLVNVRRALTEECRTSATLRTENAALRSGGPRGEGGKFVKRVHG